MHFNTPQNRERIFILCKRKDLGNLLPFPTIGKSPKTNLTRNINSIIGSESRELTPKELLRLQDFPENFKYEEKTILKQIGNAVNVKAVQKCVDFLISNEPLF